MKRKQLSLIIATMLCALILSSSSVFAGQKVNVPYVVSALDWWTGIAITNNSVDPITEMKLYFTTSTGASGFYTQPFDPLPKLAIPGIFINYMTNLDEIAGSAMLIGTISALYAKTLPSDAGSVLFSHSGSEKFSVTVYIGNSAGFAFQVFESESY